MKRLLHTIVALILVGTVLVVGGCGKEDKDNSKKVSATDVIKDLKGPQLASKVRDSIDNGDLKKAEEIGKLALKKEPKNVGVMMEMSVVYLYQKDYPKVIKMMRDAQKIAPKNPVVLNQLAWALIESKQNIAEGVALAQGSLQFVSRINQQDVIPYIDTYAYGLLKLKKYNDAIKVWEEILPRVQYGEVYVHLAQAYEGLNNKIKATELYDKSLGFLELEYKDANVNQFEKAKLQEVEKQTLNKLKQLKSKNAK